MIDYAIIMQKIMNEQGMFQAITKIYFNLLTFPKQRLPLYISQRKIKVT